jgi:hypothetical protein
VLLIVFIVIYIDKKMGNNTAVNAFSLLVYSVTVSNSVIYFQREISAFNAKKLDSKKVLIKVEIYKIRVLSIRLKLDTI